MATNKLLVVCVAISTALCMTAALANDWSVKTSIGRIVVRDDRTVIVYRKGGDWNNPGVCDKKNYAVLRPDVAPDGVEAYSEIYATLVGAHLANREIKGFISGCSTVGNSSYPRLVRVTLY